MPLYEEAHKDRIRLIGQLRLSFVYITKNTMTTDQKQNNQGKVLIIDDDQGLLRLVQMTLKAHSFEVLTATRGDQGLESFRIHQPDIVVLDVMMPGMDGMTVCKKLREHSQVPILFLTAQKEVESRIEGLMLGADDYLVKPFHIQELVARIEALLRRTRLTSKPNPQILRFGGGALVINQDSRQVYVNGASVHLSPTEYNLLLFIAQRAGKPLSITTLYNAVWSYESDADPKTVRWYIWRLRQKIEPDPNSPQYIITESGSGYRFSTI